MPVFVRTERDEVRWKKAKAAASKSLEPGTKPFWKLTNWLYHRMLRAERRRGFKEWLEGRLG